MLSKELKLTELYYENDGCQKRQNMQEWMLMKIDQIQEIQNNSPEY